MSARSRLAVVMDPFIQRYFLDEIRLSVRAGTRKKEAVLVARACLVMRGSGFLEDMVRKGLKAQDGEYS